MSSTVTIVLATAAVAVAGYALGSIPVANLVARRRGVDDLRRRGDRNPGYWNAREQLGVRAAIPVFVGDVAKGAVAAAIGAVAAMAVGDGGNWWLGYVGGGAAMVGHAWPVFDHFSGGRSVLTFVGSAVVVAPVPALAAIAVLALVWAVTRRFAWGARAGMVAFPFVQFAVEGRYRTAATGVLMTFIGLRFLLAHRGAARPASSS